MPSFSPSVILAIFRQCNISFFDKFQYSSCFWIVDTTLTHWCIILLPGEGLWGVILAHATAGNLVCPLQWRHNGHDGVSNHRRLNCLLNRLYRRKSKKTSKLCVTGICEGNSPVTGEFNSQRASNAETVSIRWRRHVPGSYDRCTSWSLQLTWLSGTRKSSPYSNTQRDVKGIRISSYIWSRKYKTMAMHSITFSKYYYKLIEISMLNVHLCVGVPHISESFYNNRWWFILPSIKWNETKWKSPCFHFNTFSKEDGVSLYFV